MILSLFGVEKEGEGREEKEDLSASVEKRES